MVPNVLIFVSTGASNLNRRRSLRKSWFQYCRSSDSPLDAESRARVQLVFVGARGSEQLQQEADTEGDIVLVDAPEGYENLWRKALVFLRGLVDAGRGEGPEALQYVMHADDDSFVRLDLLLPFLAGCPRERFYWGYIWDGCGNRKTVPIRNSLNKSRMPVSQYPLDHYPAFASGCGFVLSWDLVLELTKQPLPDYRLLDPPFGIHLCGPASEGYLILDDPVLPVHDERVRPYRAIPIFHADTIVQHYLQPEEMKPFYVQAREAAAGPAGRRDQAGIAGDPGDVASTSAFEAADVVGLADDETVAARVVAAGNDEVPVGAGDPGSSEQSSTVVVGGEGAPDQLYKTLVKLGLLRR